MENTTHAHKLVGIGELFSKTGRFYASHFKKFAALALPVSTLLLIVTVLNQLGLFSHYDLSAYVVLQVFIVVFSTAFFLASLIYPLALISGSLSEHSSAAAASVDYDHFLKRAYGDIISRFGSYLWIVFLSGIIGLAAYTVLILPGIFVQIMLSLSLIVFIAEGKVGSKALAQSWKYVKGHWWAVFGRILLAVIIMIVVMALFAALVSPLNLISGGGYNLSRLLIQLFEFFIVLPLLMIYMITIYRSLRSMKGEEITDHETAKTKQIFVWIVAIAVVFAAAFFATAAKAVATWAPDLLHYSFHTRSMGPIGPGMNMMYYQNSPYQQ